MDRIPVTREGFQRFRDELDRLKRVERPAVILEIKEARSHGDLSENAEYHAAREKQGIIEAKIRDIENNLASSEIIDCPPGPKTRVIFGSTVKLEDLDTDEVKTYRIVGPFEADINKGLISVTSPIARALIGKGLDDDIVVEAPGNTKEYEILEIS
ncbi:MAG: transcription elongation factor GreA [Deltaproteobacteria bacterium]|mgnify:FL=1|nr:MAG: transcription elongation factor GreA [Deltaproteobacteria bacterium]